MKLNAFAKEVKWDDKRLHPVHNKRKLITKSDFKPISINMKPMYFGKSKEK